MTDYIYEIGEQKICEYLDDGLSRTVVVTTKASVLYRPYRNPPEFLKLMAQLSRLRRTLKK